MHHRQFGISRRHRLGGEFGKIDTDGSKNPETLIFKILDGLKFSILQKFPIPENEKSDKEVTKNHPSANFRFSDLFVRECRFFAALIVLAPFLIYAQVYDFPFIWDDIQYPGHLTNSYIQNPTWAHFFQNFSESFYGLYVPITYSIWGFLKIFADTFGLAANSVFHLTNVLVHSVNGLLIFAILRQFVRSNAAVFAGVLVFLLHPIQVESVAWVSEFRGLLSALFTLLALYRYLRGNGENSWTVFVFFVLAILSKPSAVVLPIFIFAINHFHFHFDIRKNIVRVAPFVLVVAALAFFTLTVQLETSKLGNYIAPYWQRPFAWMNAVAFYIFKILYPANLGASYAMSPQWMSEQWWFFPLSVLPILLFASLIFFAKKFPVVALAAIFFVGGFFATSGLVSFSFQAYSLVADRYLYLSMIGIALLVAYFLERYDRKIFFAVAALMILIFAALSAFRQIPIWQSPTALWFHSIKTEVRTAYAAARIFDHGLWLAKKGKSDEALAHFDKVIAHYPDDKMPQFFDVFFYNKGVIFSLRKQHEKALMNFEKALTINPKYKDAVDAKISVHLDLQQNKEAWIEAQKAAKNGVEVHPQLRQKIQALCGGGKCR